MLCRETCNLGFCVSKQCSLYQWHPKLTEKSRRKRRSRSMTLGEITVPYHMGYERQKTPLKITAFTRIQLLFRPFSLLCAGIAPALFLPTGRMAWNMSVRIILKKEEAFFFLWIKQQSSQRIGSLKLMGWKESTGNNFCYIALRLFPLRPWQTSHIFSFAFTNTKFPFYFRVFGQVSWD